MPEEGEPDPERGRGADGAEHHAERLVLPLVDVVHVDDVDRRDDHGGRHEREGQEAERAGDDRDQDPEAERPAVGLGRRPTASGISEVTRLNDATGSPGCSAKLWRRSPPAPAPALSSAPVTGSNRAPGGATGGRAPTVGCLWCGGHCVLL